MDDELRTCRRTGCNEPAAASLSFRYDTRQVWVTAPLAEAKGTRYDLCARHAETLTVPRGWHRVEERAARASHRKTTDKATKTKTRKTGVTAKPAAEVVVPAESVALEAQDRYARLLSELPRLAAQVPLPRGQDGEGGALSSEVVGQLSIPVPERGPTDAVVVSLTELAGARRDRETLRR